MKYLALGKCFNHYSSISDRQMGVKWLLTDKSSIYVQYSQTIKQSAMKKHPKMFWFCHCRGQLQMFLGKGRGRIVRMKLACLRERE